MIMIFFIILTSLVTFNFILLAFSCNKTVKKQPIKKNSIAQTSSPITTQLDPHQLAATGS